MKNVIVSVLLLFIFNACTKKAVSPIIIKAFTNFKTTELIADNISEEITGNDEIHLLILLIKESISEPLLIKEWHDSAVFIKEENKLRYYFHYEKDFEELRKDSCKILFILLEKDTERPAESIVKTTKDIIKKYNYQNSDSLKINLTHAILDDDLLDIKFYKVSDLYKNANGTITFSGVNIFDKYQYRLKYQWE